MNNIEEKYYKCPQCGDELRYFQDMLKCKKCGATYDIPPKDKELSPASIQKEKIESYISMQENNAIQRWVSTDAFVAACKAVDAISAATGKNGLQTIEEINTFQELLKEQGFSILPLSPASIPQDVLNSISELVRTVSRAMNKKEFIKEVDEPRLETAKNILRKYGEGNAAILHPSPTSMNVEQAEQKQHIIDIMNADEKDGLYNVPDVAQEEFNQDLADVLKEVVRKESINVEQEHAKDIAALIKQIQIRDKEIAEFQSQQPEIEPIDDGHYEGKEFGTPFEQLVYWATHSGWRYCQGLKRCGNEPILKLSHFNSIVNKILKT